MYEHTDDIIKSAKNRKIYLSNEDDRFAVELFFKFTNQTGLDFLVSLQLRHRNKDDDSLLALHIDLLQTQTTVHNYLKQCLSGAY